MKNNDLIGGPERGPGLDELIGIWMREDLGNGDHTSLSTIPGDKTGTASMLVKESGILAGTGIAEIVFNRFDPSLEVSLFRSDGDPISQGDIVMQVTGSARSILQAERLVLNIMQRMSGIATRTRHYVDVLEGTGARVLDTRKTTPGFRLLEKEAVRVGGGVNHRFGLFDMILIKDNHIDFAGGTREAILAAVKYLEEHDMQLDIEVETRSLEDVREVMNTGHARRILLDNFSVEMTRDAVKMIAGKFETESSGGITDLNIRAYAECGVDFISVGALTHQVKSLDLSLKAEF